MREGKKASSIEFWTVRRVTSWRNQVLVTLACSVSPNPSAKWGPASPLPRPIPPTRGFQGAGSLTDPMWLPRRSYFACQMCHVFSALCSFHSICPKSPRCTTSPPPTSPHLRFLLPTFAVLQALALMLPPRITFADGQRARASPPICFCRALDFPSIGAYKSSSSLPIFWCGPGNFTPAVRSLWCCQRSLATLRCSSLLCSQGLTEFLLNRCTNE